MNIISKHRAKIATLALALIAVGYAASAHASEETAQARIEKQSSTSLPNTDNCAPLSPTENETSAAEIGPDKQSRASCPRQSDSTIRPETGAKDGASSSYVCNSHVQIIARSPPTPVYQPRQIILWSGGVPIYGPIRIIWLPGQPIYQQVCD